MLFSEMAKITKVSSQILYDVFIDRFCVDTRRCSGVNNEVFIALKGFRNGHDYIEKAIEKGVKNFIVSEENKALQLVNYILTNDTLKALQEIARHHRSQMSYPVFGITGSNGKTIVKEWLATLLSEKYFVSKSPKSYNSQIGVPLSILEMSALYDVGVYEAGISQVDEMSKLHTIILPSIGIFTNLGKSHDEGFPSNEKKMLEKIKLFQGVNKLIYRKEQPYSKHIENHFHKNVLCGWGNSSSSPFQVQWHENSIVINQHHFQTNLLSEINLENITHAIIGALIMKVSPEAIQTGLKKIKAVPHRLELKKAINSCHLLDDTYNNDLIGLKEALKYVQNTHHKKITLILSDIYNTGLDIKILYKQVADLLMEVGVEKFIGVGKEVTSIQKFFPGKKIFFSSTTKLIQSIPTFNDEMIVVKGARNFKFERITKFLEEKVHGTILEISYESVRHNLHQYRKQLHHSKTKIMAMVKANAYGNGIEELTNFLQQEGVDYFGVAYLDEAIQLRKKGIHLPILIMNPTIDSYELFAKYNLLAEVYSLSQLEEISKLDNPPKVHLKIDTGMHRLGFMENQIKELAAWLSQNQHIKVDGIFTHFAGADNPEHDNYTMMQGKLFNKIYQSLSSVLGYKPLQHSCNSSGIARWKNYHYDMVRLGIGLYGIDSTHSLPLRPISKLKTVVSQIKEIDDGQTVGYNRNQKVKRPTQMAIIPIGYEDGFSRLFGNGKVKVLINGKKCPTIGNICMDITMVDASQASPKVGDEVIIFGEENPIEQLAAVANTIVYEILTNIGTRVKRTFVSE